MPIRGFFLIIFKRISKKQNQKGVSTSQSEIDLEEEQPKSKRGLMKYTYLPAHCALWNPNSTGSPSA